MLTSELLTTIKTSLEDDNIYRTDAFLLERLNEGYKLTALLSMFDERRSSVNIDGTRNFFAVPTYSTDSAVCIAPLYIADSNSGKRIHPCMVDQFEYYASGWEGIVDSAGAQYYVLLNPYNYAHAAIVTCPIDDQGDSQYTIIGAFEPITLTSTAEPRIPDSHVMTLFRYTRFAAFTSEPGRAKDMIGEYKAYTEELDKFVVSIKSRFPGSRDYEPFPPEFIYENITEQEKKVAAPKQDTKNEG